VILNRQSQVALDLRDARRFARRVKGALRLGRREFNVCFVSDVEIRRLNGTYRRKVRPTDVLSFSWKTDGAEDRHSVASQEFSNFLGDIVISPATARRNAGHAGHSMKMEIRWLILHGLLHLLGYDHETDSGEMAALEIALRDRLDSGRRRTRSRVFDKRRGWLVGTGRRPGAGK
jgi:probable rRNA maturation factor